MVNGRTNEQLRAHLRVERERKSVRAEHDLASKTQTVHNKISLQDLKEHSTVASRSRRERYRDGRDQVGLSDLYRKARNQGTRARIRAEIQGSAEMRALRVASVRKASMLAGIPILAAFAAWSTAGAQAGTVRLLKIEGGIPLLASWVVEPALIGLVALIIIGRAVLASSGGKVDWRAGVVEAVALTMSLILNVIGGWPALTDWSGIVTAAPHSIGPLGCAGTAYLIGLFDGYVSAARPWDGAPRLADMDLLGGQDVFALSAQADGRTDTVRAADGQTLSGELSGQLLYANGRTPDGQADAERTDRRTDKLTLSGRTCGQTDGQTTDSVRTDGRDVFALSAQAGGRTANKPRTACGRTDSEQAADSVRTDGQALSGELLPKRTDKPRTDKPRTSSGQAALPSAEIISALDASYPEWRTGVIPSVRKLSALLGASSTTPGQRLKQSLVLIISSEQE